MGGGYMARKRGALLDEVAEFLLMKEKFWVRLFPKYLWECIMNML